MNNLAQRRALRRTICPTRACRRTAYRRRRGAPLDGKESRMPVSFAHIRVGNAYLRNEPAEIWG